MRGEEQEVLADITIILQGIQLREHTEVPSPSPVRKHKKRSGVDELQGEMNKIKPPTFDGEHKKDEDAETWFSRHEEVFPIA
jgi:hypothetical protein